MVWKGTNSEFVLVRATVDEGDMTKVVHHPVIYLKMSLVHDMSLNVTCQGLTVYIERDGPPWSRECLDGKSISVATMANSACDCWRLLVGQ